VLKLASFFFNRVTDMYNEKVYRVRFEDSEEYYALCRRLGYVAMFPFIQPEQLYMKYDFAHHDERLAANIFVHLLERERHENARDVQLFHPDGTIDSLPLGVPRSWDYIDKMPIAGVFHAKYMCSPEDRNFNLRRQLFTEYGFWKCNKSEDDVAWWCFIFDIPNDVLEFLTFLSRTFKSMTEAFLFIDGKDGNGQVTLQEFITGLKKMKFLKFKGRTKEERIKSLFRYLDPSGEGLVSLAEWGVLDQLWSETELSIQEFVFFLERTLGDDMMAVWEFFDDDDSGEIDAGEWRDACVNVGYFGPVMPIFHFLDKDGEGSVSQDEFVVLEMYQENQFGHSPRSSDIGL